MRGPQRRVLTEVKRGGDRPPRLGANHERRTSMRKLAIPLLLLATACTTVKVGNEFDF